MACRFHPMSKVNVNLGRQGGEECLSKTIYQHLVLFPSLIFRPLQAIYKTQGLETRQNECSGLQSLDREGLRHLPPSVVYLVDITVT